MTRVLVTGSRHWSNSVAVWDALDELRTTRGISLIIEGCAPGADRFAEDWAQHRGIPISHFPADWGTYGKRAGPLRNIQMLEVGLPDVVLAFPEPDSRGTVHMMSIAERAGVEVIDRGWRWQPDPLV